MEGGKLGDCARLAGGPWSSISRTASISTRPRGTRPRGHLYGDYSDVQAGARRRLLTGLVSYLCLGECCSSRPVFPLVGSTGRWSTSSIRIPRTRQFPDPGVRALLSQFVRRPKLKEESLRVGPWGRSQAGRPIDIRSPLAALDSVMKGPRQLPREAPPSSAARQTASGTSPTT